MRAWIRVLEAPGCYERAALQGSGLVRTVQRRVALMPRAANDALSIERSARSAARFERNRTMYREAPRPLTSR